MQPRRLFHSTGLRNGFLALLLATAVCGIMLLSRQWYAGHMRFSYLFMNLFLAWIPMALAYTVIKLESSQGKRVLFWFCAISWVCFFPNSNYIITDIVHVKKFGGDNVPKWFDFILTMSHACTGLFLGCFSLYLLQVLVGARIGRRFGWYFSIIMLAMAAFGIFLGRFFRLNSWDVLMKPHKIASEVSRLGHEATSAEMMAFTVTFFLFSLAAYCIFVSVARIHDEPRAPIQSE